MKRIIQAACGCHIGKVRRNNEDNFWFAGKCLEVENCGLECPVLFEDRIRDGLCIAVFDGMGGENFGEYASYSAARRLQLAKRPFLNYFTCGEKAFEKLIIQMNEAVVEVQKKMLTCQMGTTMVGLYFFGRCVYVGNVGDSRAYRLREGELLQLSLDHVARRPNCENRKAALSQYLGLDFDEVQIAPYIIKEEIRCGDVYLLCSDGLTDMLTDLEIKRIIDESSDVDNCVRELIHAALDRGGRDNVTVIVCKLL